MDIDLISKNLNWEQMPFPFHSKEKTNIHKCAVKNTSICKYFNGIKYLDCVLCSYPKEKKEK